MARNSVTAYSLEARIVMGFDDKTLKQANQQIKREAARIQQSTAAVSNTLRGLMSASGAAFGAVAGGMTIAAATASRFEESFVAVKKTLNIGPEVKDVDKAFKQIADSLITLSKISPVTTRELNEIAAVGGQLGVSAKDIVSFTKVIQKLTVATNLGAEQAALSMARLQEITGSSVDELDNLGATLVDLGNNFAATESEIVNAAMQIATATAQISGTLNNAAVDALAFSTALRAIGQPAQAGATAIVRLMNEASTAVELGGSKLEIFAATAGISMKEFVDLFAVDSTKAIALFIKGLDDTSKVGKTSLEILSELGLGQVRSRKAILALSKANDTLFDAIDTANKAFVENNALNLEAERRYDTLASQIARLKNITSAGFLNLAQDTGSLETAKALVEEISNITYLIMDNFEKISFTVAKVLGPLLAISTVFKQMNSNVRDMAVALRIFENASESINALNNVAAQRGVPTGKSFESSVLYDEKTGAGFGMRGLQGSRISMMDKVMAMPGMGLLNMFGFTGGRRRKQENLARQQYFRNRPVADAFMQGIDPFSIQAKAPQTLDEFLSPFDKDTGKGGGNIMSRLLRDLSKGTITKEMFDEITTQVVENVSDIYNEAGEIISQGATTTMRTEKDIIQQYRNKIASGEIIEGQTEMAENALEFNRKLGALNYQNLTLYDKFIYSIQRQMSGNVELFGKLKTLMLKAQLAMFRTLSGIPTEAIGMAKKLSFIGPMRNIRGMMPKQLPQLPSGPIEYTGTRSFKIPRLQKGLDANYFLRPLKTLADSIRVSAAKNLLPAPKQLPQLPARAGSRALATIPGVTGKRGIEATYPAAIIFFTKFEKILRALNAQVARLLIPLKAFGSAMKDIFQTLIASIRGQFASLAERPMSRREELVRRLARQRDRVTQSATRGPGIADVRAEAARNIARRARIRQIKENRAVIEDAKRQMRIDKILNRRRKMIRDANYFESTKGDGTLFEASRKYPRGTQIPSAGGGRLQKLRFDPEAGNVYGADRFGTYGPQPPNAIIRMQQRVNKAYAALSDAIMLQTVKLSNVLNAAAARVGAAFINLGGAFAGIGFILKNLKSLIQFSRSNFQFDFAKMGRSFIQNMALRAPKALPAGRVPKALPAPKPRIPVTAHGKKPFGQLPASTGAQDVLRVEPSRTAAMRANLLEKQRLITERLNKVEARGAVIKKVKAAAEKVETKVKAANVAVTEAADKVEKKTLANKFKEFAARKANAAALRIEERAQAKLNRTKAKEALPKLGDLKRQLRDLQTSAGPVSSRSANKQLDEFLDGLYGKGNKSFTRGRRKLILRGLDSEVASMVEKSRQLASTGGFETMKFRGKDVKVTADLAKNFDKATVSGARFVGIFKGILKFGGWALLILRAIAPVIKMIARAGAEAKGLEEYKNSLREITNEFQELQANTIKLAEARKLLAKEQNVFSPDGKTTIAETLEEYVKEQEKALAKQNKNISEQLGKAFLDGMLLVENQVDEGALAKNYFHLLEKVTGDTEQQIKDRIAVPVGEAIRGIFEMGEIPTFQNIFDELLFSEDIDGTYLSSYFKGTSREIIDAMIGDDNPFSVFQDLYTEAMADMDLNEFGLASADIGLGLFNILDKYTAYTQVKGDELAARIGQGNLFQGFTESMIASIGGSDLLEIELNQVFTNLADAFRVKMPDATDTEVGKAILDFLVFMETFNNLAGKSISDIADTLEMLPEDSDAMGALRDMLEIYLDEMTTAGYLTEREVLAASGSTTKMLQLYKNAQLAISNEITDANKKMQDEFGITAEMSLRLAIKAKEAFKQIREAATALGKPLEDAELTDVSFGKLLNNLQDNRKAIEAYEKDIAQLRTKGFEFTADRLLQMGLGGRDLAARLLEDPMAAQALEFELIKVAPATASDVGVKSPLMDDAYMDQMNNMGIQITESFVKGIEDGFPIIRQMFGEMGEEVVAALKEALGFGSPSKVMIQFGNWTSGGFAQGIKEGIPKTELAMQDMAKNSAEAFRAILGINSNSKLFTQYGQNVANGFVDGLRGAFGSAGGVNAAFDDFAELIERFGGNVEAFSAFIASTYGEGNFQTFLEAFMAGVSSKAQQYTSDQQKAFQMVTQLTGAERARNSALLNVMQSKAAYAKQLRDEASLQDRIGDTLERLNKLEQEGKAGNVTVKERIGILQKLLSLREMEKRAAGEYTAKEALAIQDKEQEVNTLARMYDKGVISALEFQAAQEELSEMKGEFKTEEDKELFFLQLADAQTEYEDAQAAALKIDQELVSTREEYFALLDEQEQMTLRVKTAQDKYSAATEGAVEADLALVSAIYYFEENIGPHIDTLSTLADSYGAITSEVDGLIEALEKYQEGSIDSIFGPGGAEITKPSIYDENKNKAIEEEFNEYVSDVNTAQMGDKMSYQQAMDTFRGSFEEAGLLDEYKKFIYNPLLSPIYKQGTALNMESNRLREEEQFMTNADLRNIKNIVDAFNNLGLQRINREESGTTILKQFIESLGLNLTRKSDGSGYTFFEKNLKSVEDKLGISLGKFLENFGDTFTGITKQSADEMASSAKNQAYIEKVLSGSPVHQEMDAGVEVANDNGTIYVPPGSAYPAVYINSAGEERIVTNDAARQAALRAGYRDTGRRPSGYVTSQGMMGLRTKGYKMGGRIPDMSHIKPKKYAMGGRTQDHMMKRALVGEYGPEEVRFVPGSGFLVKPLTTGGRGNNTIVQNLSVNVTGIPVDNASARKAAIQIKKALQRLDREGNAGGGIRNV